MKRNILLDFLKIILALMVVALHSSFLIEFNKMLSYVAVNGVFRIAVPIFFIINGYYFVNVIDNQQVKNWIKRVAFLYLLWMLVYSFFWIEWRNFSIKWFLVIIFTGFHHLWYLIAMLMSGVVVFLNRKLSNKKLLSMSFFLFLVGVSIQYIGNFHVFSSNPIIDKIFNFEPAYRNFLFFGFPFFSLGFLLKKNNWHERISKLYVGLMFIVSVVFLVAEALFNYFYLPVSEGCDMLLSLIFICPIVFLGAIIFRLTLNFNGKTISSYSTAIYLIHPLLIIISTRFFILASTTQTVFIFFLSTMVAHFLIMLNKKYDFIL
jgi:surface polysaccharide O-acyltransferase-like enzyme